MYILAVGFSEFSFEIVFLTLDHTEVDQQCGGDQHYQCPIRRQQNADSCDQKCQANIHGIALKAPRPEMASATPPAMSNTPITIRSPLDSSTVNTLAGISQSSATPRRTAPTATSGGGAITPAVSGICVMFAPSCTTGRDQLTVK